MMTKARRPVNEEHPTRLKLIETTINLMSTVPMLQISSEMVLEASGVSKGSMYHFFEDFSDLIETAAVQRFGQYVVHALEAMKNAIALTDDPEVAKLSFKEVAARQQTENSGRLRFERINLAYLALSNDRMKAKLAKEQDYLTNEWAQIYIACRDQGWAKEDLDPRAVSVLLQSTIIGRVIDDIASEQMDPDEWVKILSFVLNSIFFYNADRKLSESKN